MSDTAFAIVVVDFELGLPLFQRKEPEVQRPLSPGLRRPYRQNRPAIELVDKSFGNPYWVLI